MSLRFLPLLCRMYICILIVFKRGGNNHHPPLRSWSLKAIFQLKGVGGCPGERLGRSLESSTPPLLSPGRISENRGLDGCRGRRANGRQLYCHTCIGFASLLQGKCCPFLSFFGVCSVSFVSFLESSFFLGSFWGILFFGGELLFLLSCVGLLLFFAFCVVMPMFFHVTVFRSWACFSKILLVSGLMFWGSFSLF